MGGGDKFSFLSLYLVVDHVQRVHVNRIPPGSVVDVRKLNSLFVAHMKIDYCVQQQINRKEPRMERTKSAVTSASMINPRPLIEDNARTKRLASGLPVTNTLTPLTRVSKSTDKLRVIQHVIFLFINVLINA